MYKFFFEERFKILGCAMNRQGKTLDAVEERMPSANKSLMDGHSGPRQQRCAVEDQV